ncbi:flagellar motor protein MotA [Thauera sp.]|uniref:flagellar motor protein MotA n=1 Tax=unclassified Thauera TaxID=2609274 RepID=UPI002B809339|nr:flagellar motor protein MotA [Thauera sp.]HRP22747.1 flagellar motor protein MotA [Thauera sp.]HRP66090.1 flagellar motor protein MotA [Thauera sp.]
MERKAFTKPVHVTTWMAVFLALVALLAAALVPQLKHAFLANAAFNGVILFVLAIGIAVNLRQVWRLQREVLWIEDFQHAEPNSPPSGLRPVLLAPMARLLSTRQRGKFNLSPTSTRSILDSVQIRLEEQRDLSRYLIGLLIFLGLLGTFWGLLVTIRSIGEIIGNMSVGTDPVAMFEALKTKLDEPLGGMATSFSTSLFGLAGSLIVGFLDLQSGHAQNRFYNELEEWLSHMTKLPSGVGVEAEGNVPAYVQALLEQTAESIERMQRSAAESERERRATAEHLGELNNQLGRLADLITRESRDLSTLSASQDDLRGLIRQLAQQPAQGAQFSEDLRAELRLLSRTIAAALGGQGSHKAD